MAQTVKVRLRKPQRVFTFMCRGIPLKRDDACVVRSDRGLEYGVCVLQPEECPPEVERRFKMTVVRSATPHDEQTFSQIHLDEERALGICKSKIIDRRMSMKLVDCEYSFDRRKIIFYFTAEDRVDFRALVRDLAQDLKARIELRHIQVRDEAKMVGGLGGCGRELCCTTWMQDFMPISMKMAKRQNLSLNPSKISGQCGRLMCCLSYENELYSDQKKKRPPKETKRETLANIRNQMEDDPRKATEVLKDSSLKDVAQEPSADVDEKGEPQRPPAEPERSEVPPTDAQPSGAQATEPARSDATTHTADKTGDSTRTAPAKRGRRRRSNRGGRGRNRGGRKGK